MRHVLRQLSLLMLLVLLFGCAPAPVAPISPSAPPPATLAPSPTAPALRRIVGTIAALDDAALTLQVQGNVEYVFPLPADGLVSGASQELLVGQGLELSYRGEIDRARPTQDVQITAAVVVVHAQQERVQAMLMNMTLEEKIGQLFLPKVPPMGATSMVENYQLGGYVLFARDFEGKTPEQVRDTIARYQAASKIPMLISIDEEGGTVVRASRFSAFRQAAFKSPQALFNEGGLDRIAQDATEKSRFLLELGINLNLAPVADTCTSAGAYMYSRAFGQDAAATATYVRTVVEAMNAENMGASLKHFPGYGSNADTHTGIANDKRPYEEFMSADFIPFREGIEAGAGSVLVTHNIVHAMDDQNPASLSAAVHEILRTELGFEGVIITDELSMDAIRLFTGSNSAAVLAIAAGNDMLCTTDVKGQFAAVLKAVQEGTITQERIDESVLRILKWKAQLGLID